MKRTKTVGIWRVWPGMLAFLLAASALSAEESWGLVLAGGGAKGAYEAGVWEALADAGLTNRIGAISGTSVGAMNAALFAAVGDVTRVQEIWLDGVNGFLSVNKDYFRSLGTEEEQERWRLQLEKNIRADKESEARRFGIPVEDLSEESVREIEERCTEVYLNKFFLKHAWIGMSRLFIESLSQERPDGFFDASRLDLLVDGALPAQWPLPGMPAVYATALRREPDDEFALATFALHGVERKSCVDGIVASASIPGAFEHKEFDGESYVDGGLERLGGDNIPIGPILEKHPEIRTVVVVYLKDAEHLDRGRRKKVVDAAERAGVRLVEIVPSEDIGRGFLGWQGVFDARPETAKHLMELGREDARKKLSEAWP